MKNKLAEVLLRMGEDVAIYWITFLRENLSRDWEEEVRAQLSINEDDIPMKLQPGVLPPSCKENDLGIDDCTIFVVIVSFSLMREINLTMLLKS